MGRMRLSQESASQSEVTTLGGGCFWCLEAVYELLNGVERVVSGYAAGSVPNPSYQQVCTGATGHAEVVQLTFDPSVISFKDVLDVFLDLALEEELETEFERREVNSDEAAMTALLTSPYTIIGQSDGGAHVVFRTDYSYSTYLLSHWVREKGIMSLEEAIRKLTFVPASLFGLFDRGLVRSGMAADLMVFDPETIAPLEPGEAHDLPGGAKRRKQLAQGIEWTVVNGQVLLEKGKHTGVYPGKVARNPGLKTA